MDIKPLPELFLTWEDVAKALQTVKHKPLDLIELDGTETDVQYTDSVERDVESWQK
ncbi:MAG: hypothetical protein KDA17_02615 [Candidatus Saccharibacteria bacterium]|nr:hypothetical protein [Candidatus Saccharibacteria bacterium]